MDTGFEIIPLHAALVSEVARMAADLWPESTLAEEIEALERISVQDTAVTYVALKKWHQKAGFREVNRVVCYVQNIRDSLPENPG